MPDQGMGQMIQLITALAGIQQQRRELDMKQKQMDASASQFAQSMGFEEKSAEHKKFTDLLKQIADSGTKQRGALVDAGKALGFNDDEVKALSLMAANAPETIQAIQQGAVSSARAAQTPQQQMAQNQEIASASLTGMNQGQAAQSGLQAVLAGGAQGQVTPAMQSGYAQKTATGQTGLDALISATIAQNPDMRNRMAAVTAGTGMTASQESQATIGQGGVEAEFMRIRQESIYHQAEIAERLMTAKSQGSLSPGLADMAGKMIEAAKAVVDPKSDQASRIQAKALYNRLAQTIGWNDLQFTDPGQGGPASTGERFRNSLGPFAVPNPPASQPPAGGYFTPPNPLQQFVRPPQ